MNKGQKRETALWRLERDLCRLQAMVLVQDGGASESQWRDMDRMKRDIRILKTKLGIGIGN